jgi:hypothetical protein
VPVVVPDVLPPGALLPELAPPDAVLPELELEGGGVLALPADELPEDVPEPGLPAPVVGELTEGRVELAEVAKELGPAEPPHPAIAAIKNEENNSRLCRILASADCAWHIRAASTIKGNY